MNERNQVLPLTARHRIGYALGQLGKRRNLTPELLEECLYDSNDEIRTYACRALNRRKRRTTP